MQVHRSESTPTTPAPESTFTGDVRIGGYHRRPAPSRLVGATVTFGPGARTPWKVNPCGQTVVVLDGVGRAGAVGEETVEVRAGDLLWFPAGQQHWEGAAPDHPLTYVALQEEDRDAVRFLSAVTDAEYAAPEGSS